MVTNGNYATSYALTADELYYNFPTKKYVRITKQEYGGSLLDLYAKVLKYFFYLVIIDIIENGITFKFPPGVGAWMEMVPISGDDFVRARKNGAFDDIDFLASNFTGYLLYLRIHNRYGTWTKLLHVSKKYKDRITELTNQGNGW